VGRCDAQALGTGERLEELTRPICAPGPIGGREGRCPRTRWGARVTVWQMNTLRIGDDDIAPMLSRPTTTAGSFPVRADCWLIDGPPTRLRWPSISCGGSFIRFAASNAKSGSANTTNTHCSACSMRSSSDSRAERLPPTRTPMTAATALRVGAWRSAERSHAEPGIVKLFGNACGVVDVSDSVAEYSG
jgi:hypothetical protein